MSTLNQCLKKSKKKRKIHKSWAVALKKCPQRKGICIKVLKESPKKPNSANRSVVKVRLTTGRSVRAQIPGEKHNLIKFNKVLIRGGRTRDLPGVKYRVIRGVLDCKEIIERRQSISKYGLKAALVILIVKKQFDDLFKK